MNEITYREYGLTEATWKRLDHLAWLLGGSHAEALTWAISMATLHYTLHYTDQDQQQEAVSDDNG